MVSYARDEADALRIGPVTNEDGARIDLTGYRIDVAVREYPSRASTALLEASTTTTGITIDPDQSDETLPDKGRGCFAVAVAGYTAAPYRGHMDCYITAPAGTPIRLKLDSEEIVDFIVDDGLADPNA
jgi:hypothetical protein